MAHTPGPSAYAHGAYGIGAPAIFDTPVRPAWTDGGSGT